MQETRVQFLHGKDPALVAQVQQSPVVMIATQDDAAAFTTVATVRTAVRVILHVAQMH